MLQSTCAAGVCSTSCPTQQGLLHSKREGLAEHTGLRGCHHAPLHRNPRSPLYTPRRSKQHVLSALPPDQVVHHMQQLLPHLTADPAETAQAIAQHASLAYERVALPCSTMNCGDVIYRSTLDPALRMEKQLFPNPRGLALLAAALAYLTATPGVLVGAIDYYLLAPLQRLFDPHLYGKEDIKIGRKIATGGFGTVYNADLYDGNSSKPRPVIVKKAKEFGEAEVWMNERLMRSAPANFARFITAFEEDLPNSRGLLWLVWQYEGEYTLSEMMGKKDFPYNLEPLLFQEPLDMAKGPRRKLATLRLVMQQLLQALKASHSTGIVHRDVKPHNCIISDVDGRIKLIDLGAAADLRVGINYVPNEFLLDPRYAPPQQYIMSTSTVKAPPAPVAALLSPILWQLEKPDRFDMYSAGILLLQLVFPPLRNDNALIAFNRKLQSFEYDLQAWRAFKERSKANKEWQEGFALADLDDGAVWDLLCKLVQYEPTKRLTAAAALRHPCFTGGPSLLARVDPTRSIADALSQPWLEEAVGSTGTQRVVPFTEQQLSEELGPNTRMPMPKDLRYASSTVAWWQGRQSVFKQKLADRRSKMGRDISNIRNAARSTIRETKERVRIFSWGKTNG